jgi:selenocysteine lyase/cysteine desulfurase
LPFGQQLDVVLDAAQHRPVVLVDVQNLAHRFLVTIR